MLPSSRVKFGVGWRGHFAGDPEKGAKGIEWVEPSIESERELGEVGLKMLVADAVMDAGQPGLEVGKDEVDDWQILFRHLGIAPLGDGEMLVAALERALIGRYALVGSFAQCGSKPYFSRSRWRPPVTG